MSGLVQDPYWLARLLSVTLLLCGLLVGNVVPVAYLINVLIVKTNGDELASFPGLPTVQFLIACSMQKRKGKAWYHLSRK